MSAAVFVMLPCVFLSLQQERLCLFLSPPLKPIYLSDKRDFITLFAFFSFAVASAAPLLQSLCTVQQLMLLQVAIVLICLIHLLIVHKLEVLYPAEILYLQKTA
jgi:hypothetical protein